MATKRLPRSQLFCCTVQGGGAATWCGARPRLARKESESMWIPCKPILSSFVDEGERMNELNECLLEAIDLCDLDMLTDLHDQQHLSIQD